MPTADQITDLTPTVDVVADVIRHDTSYYCTLGDGTAKTIARDVLNVLIGPDDEPGPLDRYEIRAEVIPSTGKPVVMWYCPRRDHGDGNSDGHAGIIARNLDGDQSGLTLGEILGSVLQHERDEHEPDES